MANPGPGSQKPNLAQGKVWQVFHTLDPHLAIRPKVPVHGQLGAGVGGGGAETDTLAASLSSAQA